MRIVLALLIGMVFGLGIAIAGMANPAKVLNFFDVAGSWDPSLLVVMISALVTTAIGYRLVFGRLEQPVLDKTFNLPVSRAIDARLIGGSALFGIGWGVTGFCPGGAIPALGLGYTETFLFVGAMMLGIVAARALQTSILKVQSV
ncbi:DUF6691 family protein [Oricola thermophila]|uniref:YeeE/YedE family protein n=1 Tax=Oricola thermophila TaxID=2742145 RepID=A0A6N1VAM6_9HYPH|nr:DUF6691 family protein [Oricola thermophila]QKV17593.1 YeeE/YedE family protein [Oricola thermophila]